LLIYVSRQRPVDQYRRSFVYPPTAFGAEFRQQWLSRR